MVLLDSKLQAHHNRFLEVKEYADCEKPKLYLRYNYPVDEAYLGPMIRTWCMTFEGVLQILKLIASHSNYKGVCKRMARIWGIRQGLMLVQGKMADIFSVDLSYASPSITVAMDRETGEVLMHGTGQNSTYYATDYFGQQVAPHEQNALRLRYERAIRLR